MSPARATPPRRTRVITDSPIGPLTLLAVNGSLAGLYMEGREPEGPDGLVPADSTDDANALVLDETARQLEEYFAGQRRNFDLPLGLEGTSFQRQVWEALLDIPFGETTSYGKLASEIGRPTAARAVGMANGSNPVSIIVPCHRVVGSNGSLTGYGGGLDRKQRLLDMERQVSQH